MNQQVRKAMHRAMEERGLSGKELAKRAGCSQDTVSRLLRGATGGVPKGHQKVLGYLGIELVILPKELNEDTGSSS